MRDLAFNFPIVAHAPFLLTPEPFETQLKLLPDGSYAPFDLGAYIVSIQHCDYAACWDVAIFLNEPLRPWATRYNAAWLFEPAPWSAHLVDTTHLFALIDAPSNVVSALLFALLPPSHDPRENTPS